MATQTTFAGGKNGGVAWAFSDAAGATANQSLVPAVAGKRIRVLGFTLSSGATPATVIFQTSTGHAAISPTYNNSIVHPRNTPSQQERAPGWFETNAGDALEVTTGAGSTTGILVIYDTIG